MLLDITTFQYVLIILHCMLFISSGIIVELVHNNDLFSERHLQYDEILLPPFIPWIRCNKYSPMVFRGGINYVWVKLIFCLKLFLYQNLVGSISITNLYLFHALSK